jgi:predicted HTH domain antitoxin
MTLTISDEFLVAARMSEDEMRQEVAVMLFVRDRMTLAQAARFAGQDLGRFQHLLASRDITVHYDVPEFEADLQTLRELGRA